MKTKGRKPIEPGKRKKTVQVQIEQEKIDSFENYFLLQEFIYQCVTKYFNKSLE